MVWVVALVHINLTLNPLSFRTLAMATGRIESVRAHLNPYSVDSIPCAFAVFDHAQNNISLLAPHCSPEP